MSAFHHSCQGYSHIDQDKPCQDASYSHAADRLTIAMVCDGHGGECYFRSDVGARLAIEAARENIETFVREADLALFRGKPFTQKQTIEMEAKANVFSKSTSTDEALRQLFSSIIYSWRERIKAHWQANPLTEEERQRADERLRDELERGIGMEKTYGCTLMAFVSTPAYWLAFHVGDGKLIAFDAGGRWSEPIPWDDRCFLNKTTSLCDSGAIGEFRYCYEGDGAFPMAVCLGSDGIDDSFGATENLVNFYVQLLKLAAREGTERAQESLKESLPELSRIGSKDDMSVACIYDDGLLSASVERLIEWQIKNVSDNIEKVNERIQRQRDIIGQLELKASMSQREKIDLQYARQSLERARKDKEALEARLRRFQGEHEEVCEKKEGGAEEE